MQTRGPLFDDLAQLLTGAAGAAQGVREEIETLMRAQVERAADQMDLVPREDFEAVRALALKATDRIDSLEAEIAALKAGQPGSETTEPAKPKSKTTSKKKTTTKSTR